jgi:outer membrane lipoprotein-sorting protein
MKGKRAHRFILVAGLAFLLAPVQGAAGGEKKKPGGGEKKAAPAAEGKKAPAPDSADFPVYVMNRIDDLYRGARSHGTMEMEVKTKNWTRTMTAETWSMGKEYSLVRILSPKKEMGNATLKAKGDLFTYLSKTGKTIKITSGMMGSSWMGSHFTNDDLVRHTRLSEDYTIKKNPDVDESGTKACSFTLVPKPDAPVVWGKIDVIVRQSDLMPLRQVFYDEEGKKVRELKFSDHKEVDGRLLPMTMVMRPLDGSGEYTRVAWKKIDFKVSLDKTFFTLQKLKSL